MTTVTLPRLLAAAGIGILYYWATASAWGILSATNPINDMLLDAFVRNEKHIHTYRALISMHDLLVNLLMALPFAAVFRFVPALRNWTFVMRATAAAFISSYASMQMDALPDMLASWAFWLGVVMITCSLPTAFMLWNRVFRSPLSLQPAGAT